ncbi:MAG: type IX secretion system sortase PorU, partial [Saprospiraceae bacterium]|nr:type IX secretion system sortase PorU [Saprospiraceae bacterium]
MKKALSIFVLALLFAGLQAQTFILEDEIRWSEEERVIPSESVFAESFLHFSAAHYSKEKPFLPFYFFSKPVSGPGEIQLNIVKADYEPLEANLPEEVLAQIPTRLEIVSRVNKARNQYFAQGEFIPLVRDGAVLKKLVGFTVEARLTPTFSSIPRTTQTFESVLNEGQIFKLSITEVGVYRLDSEFFSSILGLDPQTITPGNIQLFSTPSGPLPEPNNVSRTDDLAEIPFQFYGGDDGSFDSGDYALFWADGPHRWNFDEDLERFTRSTDPYSFEQFFFLKVGSESGARISPVASLPSGEYVTDSFDDYQQFEEDKFNILFQEDGAQGSGRQFFGDLFLSERSRDFSFDFPNIVSGNTAELYVRMAGRAGTSSRFNADWNGSNFQSTTISQVSIGNPIDDFARAGNITAQSQVLSTPIDFTLNYPALGDGTNKAWLDFIEINARRELIHVGDFMVFQDAEVREFNSAQFELEGPSDLMIWDISDDVFPMNQDYSYEDGELVFSRESADQDLRFVSFDPTTEFPAPALVSIVDNQNLHGLDRADLVILYHPEFAAEAERLADHRRAFSDFVVELVSIEKVWNEFGGGKKDPVSIRDFCKMLYDRDEQFRYLLLFGDASFDARDIYQAGQNFVPTFETKESFDPILSYPADDFFGLLDADEGGSIAGGLLDLGIGRITCRTLAEAKTVVDKIIHYDNSPQTLGDWRNRIVYIGDDEDGNTHLNDSDDLATETFGEHPEFNAVKIYLDAYRQEATAGGTRFPLATEDLNRNMFRGALVMNYFGHGGSQGWAQERVLDQQDIQSWENLDRMPLIVTATCTFAGFDGPELTSGGELALLNPNGGPVALYSTTRAVYSNSNDALVSSVFETLFQPNSEVVWTLGDIFRKGKNESNTGHNARKFALLGDPSQTLKVPPLEVRTTSINGKPVSDQTPDNPVDTLEALDLVTVSGIVLDE